MRRFILVTTIGVALVLLPSEGLGQKKEEGISLYNEATELQKKAQTHEDLKRAVEKYEEALRIFERIGWKKAVGDAANKLGNVNYDWGRYDKALKCFKESLEIARDVSDRMAEGNALINLGNVYYRRGRYDEALERYRESLAIKRESGDRQGEGINLYNIAWVYKRRADYDTALDFFRKSLTIKRELKDHAGEGMVLNDMGWVYDEQGLYEKALQQFGQLLALRTELKDQQGVADALDSMGWLHYNLAQYDKALELCSKALSIAQRFSDRKTEASALNHMGLVYSDRGQNDKAEKLFRKSLTAAREVRNRWIERHALNNLGLVYSNWGQYEKAIEYYNESLVIKRELNDRRGEGQTLNNLGLVFAGRGQYDKAVLYYEKDLAICRELKDRRGEGITLNNLGNVYKDWGQYDKAVSRYEKSLAIARAFKNRQGESNSMIALGMVFADWGQYDAAVSCYEKSLAICRELKDRSGEGNALNNLGLVFADWGQYDKAVSYYEKDLAICRELKDRRGEGTTLNNLGLIFSAWGQYDKAVSYYEKSLAIKGRITDPLGEGRTLCNLGAVYAHREQTSRALDCFLKGLAIWQKIKVPTTWPRDLIANLYLDEDNLRKAEPLVKEAGYWSTRGRFYLLQSDYEKAKIEYEKLLESAEKSRNAENLFTSYTGLGLTYEGMKDKDKAAEYFRKAVTFTEELRTSLTAAQREKFFDVKINGFLRTVPYEGLARVLMRMRKPKDSFKGSEYTKARVFAETISRQAEGQQFDIPAAVLKKDREITDQLAALKKQRQKAHEKNNELNIEALEPQIKELEAKLEAHIKMLRDKYPLFAATRYPEPMDLSQAALTDDECTLSYDVTDSGVIIYLTKGKELVKSLFKPVARKEVDELVRKFREPLEVGHENFIQKLESFDFASGKKLSDLLLSDALPSLPEGTPVVIVPDDSLGVLPFEMLVLNDAGKVTTDGDYPTVQGAEFFGDRNPISYYQSITALTLARTFGKAKKAATRRMVMADPVFDPKDHRLAKVNEPRRIVLMKSMPDKLMSIKNEMGLTFIRLPLTGELAKSLKKLQPGKTDLFVGMMASKPMLFEKPLAKYIFMVFATHGYFGKDLPGIQEPVLILTLPGQPEGQDGFLRMSEVMGLQLNADVVALTACQTGLGKRLTGEGTMGMGRAFQYAGAKAVLMSLWSVAEESSVDLVGNFFRHLNQGKGKLEALRLARKEIRDAGYDHPFFWSAFILAGEVN